MSNDLVQALRAAADTIDERLGPVSGGDADRLAELAREASHVLDEHDVRVTSAEAKERERCLWWVRAYAAYPKDNPAAKAIEEGRPKP